MKVVSRLLLAYLYLESYRYLEDEFLDLLDCVEKTEFLCNK